MGGGAAMRAAAKVAGMNMGLRGVPGAEHPFAAAARKAVSPVKALFNSTTDHTTQSRPYWDDNNNNNNIIDEWELAGGEEELMTEEARLVFGGAPTLKEAQDATFELKEAVNKAYLSPDDVFSNDESGIMALVNSEDLESKACVVKDTTTSPTLPTQAMQAFRLLNDNTVAQKVVASIASDPNVWNAVLQNEALVGFLRSQKSRSEMDASSEKSADEDMSELDYYNSEERNVIENMVINMKDTVVEMMNTLSDYFQNLFGGTVAPDGSVTNSIDKDKAMSASFMGLAVMVMMVVVLDRP